MNALDVQGLTKRYSKFCLDHVSFSVPEGSIMGLIGENGAGKTTTMKAMLQLIRKDEGTVRFFGEELDKQRNRLLEDIGIVLSEGSFPESFTVKNVSQVLKKAYRNWREEYFYQLADRFSLPKDKSLKELSKGNQKKVLLFSAMAHQPKLLILDEATNDLDPMARDDMLDLFNEFTRDEGHSILISSHIVTDLEKICDYITFLHKGRLMFTEEKDLLKEQYGFLHVTEEELLCIPKDAVKGLKRNDYGVEALVKREMVPGSMAQNMECPSIETIMLFLTKEAVK